VIELKKKFVLKMNEGTLKIVEDMISLDEINEPIILNNIRQRYLTDSIYVRFLLLIPIELLINYYGFWVWCTSSSFRS